MSNRNSFDEELMKPHGHRNSVGSVAGANEFRANVTTLQQQLNDIRRVISAQTEERRTTKRETQGEVLNEEYSDENPYSRVMHAQTEGLLANYERIRGLSVAVVGCSGVGVQVCEMLTRFGVGLLNIYDRDHVHMGHMSRMFFRPEHTGWAKTQVARHYLGDINPDVRFRSFTYDIHNRYEDFAVSLRRASIDESVPADLVLCCVDNREAVLAVNEACHELNIPWIAADVGEDAMTAHLYVVIPGVSACAQCSQMTSTQVNPHVSLPSTDSVISGLMGMAALKQLLSFGEPKNVSINLLTSVSTPSAVEPPNPECPNELCRKRQQGLVLTSTPE